MKTKALLSLALPIVLASAARLESSELHFALSASVPEADSSVPSPQEIRLRFTEVPQENSVAIRLINAAEHAVETGEPAPDPDDGRTVIVSVESTLPTGKYTVAWRGMGDDGHVVRGDFAFSVSAQE
jgi:methionine-rich copper-binding protein CopC